MFRETMSRWSSGSITWRSAWRTDSFVGPSPAPDAGGGGSPFGLLREKRPMESSKGGRNGGAASGPRTYRAGARARPGGAPIPPLPRRGPAVMLRRTTDRRDSASRSARMGLLDRLLGRAGAGRDEGPRDAAFPPLDPDRAAQAVARGEVAVLDVRFEGEFSRRRIPGARLVPLAELPARLGELDRGRDLLVVCGKGGRAVEACRILKTKGFEKVRWLRGGLADYPGPVEGERG